MAALIKGTLIKQISKFLKNVTPNQINISTLKGEGEMTNIELDENVLMDLLELPLWLKITNARCNKAAVKVPWTKLKTNPIMISLDKIDLDVEIADPVREYHPEGANKLFDKDSQGAYGFIDKCIDAIQLNIDSVNINIKSNFLTANLNISNIYIFSTTPHWKPASDIRMTRLRDIDRDEIILYKVITWEICRLEAFNLDSGSGTATGAAPTSIKLIMNPSQMQIALKKKLSDKSLVNSKVRVLLNEIYWMANDTQLKAAIGTYTSLSKLMTKAFAQKIKYANLQMSANKPKTNLPQSPLSNANQPPNQSKIDISKVFMHYDIKETSLHLQITNLNIHLYADENYSGNKQIDGGAMQVLFKNLCIDHYPYHKIGSSITHWNNYNYAFKQRDEWSRSILNEFVAKLDSILNKSEVLFDLNRFKLKNHINLLEACTIVTLKDLCIYKVTTNMSDRTANISAMKTTKKSQADSSQNSAPPLRNPNDILHKDNYFIEQQVFDRRPFLSSNYAEFNLPTDETLFANVIFSEFYFPDECNFPLPAPQLFVQCSPIILNIDFLSLLWVNTLMFSLYRQKLIVDESELKSRTPRPNQEAVSTPMQHCDTYIEFITPKMVLSIYPTNKKLDYESKTFLKRPSTIEFGVARLFLTNQMTEHNLSTNSKKFSDLKSTSDRCYELSKSLCNKYGIFKSQDPTLCNLAPCFGDLLKNENCPYVRYDLSFNEDMAANLVNTTKLANNAKEGLFLKTLSRTALNKNPAKDLWTAEFESAWIDFKDPLTNENSTFLENTSFRFYMVNVWDFYSNGRGPMNKTPTSPPSKTIANYKRAYDRLSNLIDLSNSQTNGGVNNNSFDENDSNRDVIASSPVTTKHRAKRRSISGSGEAINMHDYGSTICKSLYSQVNVIGEIKEVHLALNHAQVLFLLRLVDTMDLFMNQLKKDSEHTLKYKSNGSAAKKDATPKIKCLNLEDLPHLKTHTDTSESSSINIALSIKNIELDLMVNDLHKEKLGTIKKEKQEQLFDLDEPESENEPTPAATAVFSNKSSTESPINEERDINKEFVAGYVKFIYGLSSDNPNQSFKFQPAVAGPSAPLRVSSSSSQVMFSAASVDSGIETAKPSSVSSSGNFTVSFSSSSSSSTGISFSKSRASSNAKATTPPGQAPQQQMPNDADLFADDGDNLSLIMSLEADDLINIELGGPPGTTAATNSAAKMSNLLSSRSVSEASVCTAAAATNSSSSTDPSLMKSDSDVQSRPTMKDDESQTEDRKTKVKIKLTNMNVYVQDRDENTLVMARLGRLWLQNRRSSPNSEITIRMRKMPHDLECADGLVELVMENLKLDAYLFTVLGLVELVDDDDDNDNAEKKREAKKSLPVNIFIKNSQFNLSDDGEEKYAKFEDDPKLLPLSIERLELSKLSDNRIIIRDIKSTLSSDEWVKNGRLLLSPVGLKKEIDYLNQFKYDLTFIEFNTKFKFQSDKFASLVHLLREAKDANSRLDEEKSRLKKELDKKEAENTSLKQELAKLNESKLDSDYFESALKALREENELLRKGLEKSEDSVNLLKLERERYLQLLNEK